MTNGLDNFFKKMQTKQEVFQKHSKKARKISQVFEGQQNKFWPIVSFDLLTHLSRFDQEQLLFERLYQGNPFNTEVIQN